MFYAKRLEYESIKRAAGHYVLFIQWMATLLFLLLLVRRNSQKQI